MLKLLSPFVIRQNFFHILKQVKYMKKISQVVISISLILLSFFYTNKMIDLLKNNDPIMKTIKSKEDSFKVDAVNAKV